MYHLRRAVKILGYKIAEWSEWGMSQERTDLLGDRDIEWSWIAAKLPERPGRVLDFGPATSYLGLIAALRGGDVLGFDLVPQFQPYALPNLAMQAGEIGSFDFGERRFDTIINCSTVEHVGLYGRYGNPDDADGDIKAMARLRDLLSGPDAVMVLTIPVGKDGVYSPYHRIYGEQRLPRLLAGYQIAEERYFAKTERDNRWRAVEKTVALSVQGSSSFYGLGLFVLKRQ